MVLMVLPVILLALSVELAHGQTDTVSYAQNGADWTGNCASTVNQSPIDVTDTTSVDSSDEGRYPVTFAWKSPSTYTILNQGHTYSVTGDFGTITFGGNNTYNAAVYHFHAPSEHYLDGKQYPLEFHLGNIHPLGISRGLMGFSVLFEEGSENEALAGLLASSPTPIDLSAIVGGRTVIDDYYAYMGSGTTPNCLVNVPWVIYGKVLEASAAQLQFFQNKWQLNQAFAGGKGNNRALHDRGNREVIHFDDSAREAVVLTGLLLLLGC